MKINSLIWSAAVILSLSSCVSKPVDTRQPAGVADIGSSTTESSFESYKLPITRDGKKVTRVAANFWGGEWPSPVINVGAGRSGTTTITGYNNLRNPQEFDKMKCTIKNGLYHPWSKNDDSAVTYYTLQGTADFAVIKDTSYELYNSKTKKVENKKVPAGATFKNVVGYGENYCGAIYEFNKTKRPFQASCDFFYDNKSLKQTTTDSDFSEQWIYLTCEEKSDEGEKRNIKVFIQDKDLLSQPGVTQGCPGKYGTVKADCSDF